MQLVAYGAQDVYLTGNPQITFWKVTYRRHTNFAMESIEQTFNGQADFGRRVTCTISRNGDLAYRTYLQVTLPEIDQDLADNVYARWLDFPGEQLVSQVEVEIGGQLVVVWYMLSRKNRSVATTKWLHTTTTYIRPQFADVDGPVLTVRQPVLNAYQKPPYTFPFGLVLPQSRPSATFNCLTVPRSKN